MSRLESRLPHHIVMAGEASPNAMRSAEKMAAPQAKLAEEQAKLEGAVSVQDEQADLRRQLEEERRSHVACCADFDAPGSRQ